MPAPFFVAVNHQGHPKRQHATLEHAQAEAQRLYDLRKGIVAVYVLETVNTLPALVPIAEVSETGTIRLTRKPKPEAAPAP